jgi:hypothetical protein
MKKTLLLATLVPFLSWAQSSMDTYRWYLNPNGQELLISIDDLHDERITASPLMNWGRDVVPTIELKKEIVIAIIDGGVEVEHPELKNHIAYNEAECFEGRTIPPKDGEDKDGNGYKGDCAGWNFVQGHNRAEDLDGHGTHVTGVIRSALAGVKGEFKFLPLNVFAPGEGTNTPKDTPPLPTRLTKAFEYALARKVDVIHLSVGWPRSFMTPELEAVIKKAIAQGVAVVAAAGNSSQRATIYPCQLEGVICVGALRANGDVARFSNWGSQVDIFAPGEKILSTIPVTIAPLHISRKGYDYKNGTSQAAPFISASMALLRGVYPQESLSSLYSRLMLTADAPIEESGIKGLFHIDRALSVTPSSLVLPQLKGVHGIRVDDEGRFALEIGFKNFWLASKKMTVRLVCEEAQLETAAGSLAPLETDATQFLSFSGQVSQGQREINCTIGLSAQSIPLKLKVLHDLRAPFKTLKVQQETPLVVDTRLGARSRFLTLNAIKGHHPEPLYYIPGKDVVVYREDQVMGTLPLANGCTFLRVWQINLDGLGANELMLETLCEKTYLQYQFLDTAMNALTPAVTFKPSLTILNYDDFEVLTQKDAPPIFKFLGYGFAPPTDSPWDSDISSKANRLYELRPMKTEAGWKYEPVVFEKPELWVKSLGLRFLPSYQVLHYLDGKLLVKLGQKTAWVDVATQQATWAGLDDLMLQGSQKQKLWGTEKFILQSMLTAFDYRGYVVNGVRLRFQQADRFDPFLDILGTQQNAQGYLTVLRSFQKLIYLQYDFTGKLVSRKDSTVDRFDFLTAEDLIASVINLPLGDSMLQVVDGTKINTQYIDVVNNVEMVSYEIPKNCVTQQPVVMDGRAALPVFCTVSRTEFEMRFIEL